MKKLFCFIICFTFALSNSLMAVDNFDLDTDEEVTETSEQHIEKKQAKNIYKSKHIQGHKHRQKHVRKKPNKSLTGKRKNRQYHKRNIKNLIKY